MFKYNNYLKFIPFIIILLSLTSCFKGLLKVSEPLNVTVTFRGGSSFIDKEYSTETFTLMPRQTYRVTVRYKKNAKVLKLHINDSANPRMSKGEVILPIPAGFDMERGGNFELSPEETRHDWGIQGNVSIEKRLVSTYKYSRPCYIKVNYRWIHGEQQYIKKSFFTEYHYNIDFVDPEMDDILAIFEGKKTSHMETKVEKVGKCG